MRVLLLTGEFPPMPGGVGDCTNEIAQALAQRGVEVSVLTSADQAASDSTHQDQPAAPDPVAVFRTMPHWGWSSLRLIRHALSVTRADILHIQYQTGAFGMHPMIDFAPGLLKLYPFVPRPRGRGGWGARSVVTFHDLLPPYLFPKAGAVRDRVTFHLARSCDAVIATNAADRWRLEQNLRHPVSLIPIGSNVKPTLPPGFDRTAFRARLGVLPDQTLLCYFGFLSESKGGETLIRALAEIPDAKLVIIGAELGASNPGDAEYLARVKTLIEQLHVGARVIWTGRLPPMGVSAHFGASDICVLPYRDGASFRRGTFMAALAHGMPIITTAAPQTPSAPNPPSVADGNHPVVVSDLPELRDDENVVLVPPDDPHAIALAVNRVRASPDLRARLSRGASAAAAFFSWDKIADLHLRLYQQLLDL